MLLIDSLLATSSSLVLPCGEEGLVCQAWLTARVEHRCCIYTRTWKLLHSAIVKSCKQCDLMRSFWDLSRAHWNCAYLPLRWWEGPPYQTRLRLGHMEKFADICVTSHFP